MIDTLTESQMLRGELRGVCLERDHLVDTLAEMEAITSCTTAHLAEDQTLHRLRSVLRRMRLELPLPRQRNYDRQVTEFSRNLREFQGDR